MFSIALSLGTYAFVKCTGESSFRTLWTEPADIGQAAGQGNTGRLDNSMRPDIGTGVA